MRNQLYQIALECQQYANNNIKIGRNKIPFPEKCLLFTDYDVIGDIEQYEKLLLKLYKLIKRKHPSMALSLKAHIDNYDVDRIIHFSAIQSIVDCIVALEESATERKKIFISHSSKDKPIVMSFIKEILKIGCGFKDEDIFCTLDPSAIRTGDDFREQIIENTKKCDYILLFISENYNLSDVCKNEMGAAWALEGKRVLPFILPGISFKQMGFLNVVKQGASITERRKLDELYQELCSNYDMVPDWPAFNTAKDDFLDSVKALI